MKRNPIFLLIWLLVFVVIGCNAGKKALKKGHYYDSSMMAIEQLRSSPNHKKSQEVLRVAYPLAESNSLRIINNAMDANMAKKYIIAADEYLALNRLADAIFYCPKALELFPDPNQYSKELGEILPLAAEDAYSIGEKQLEQGTIESAKDAYFNFVKADEYVEGYRDVNEKIREALYIATFKVVVRKPVMPKKYELTANFFYDNLMAEMSRGSEARFVRFYTYEEARKENLKQPDQYMVLDFEEFSIGNVRESKNTFEVTRDSVLVGTTKIDDEEREVFGTVKADVVSRRREVISSGVLAVRLIDAYNDRVLENRSFPGEFVWFNEWMTYKGDERALDKNQKKLADSEPILPPSQQNLFIEFTKPIFDQTVRFVRNYYKNFE